MPLMSYLSFNASERILYHKRRARHNERTNFGRLSTDDSLSTNYFTQSLIYPGL